MKRTTTLSIVTFLCLFLTSLLSFGSDLYWRGISNSWSDPSNWSLSPNGPAAQLLPGPNDNVFFSTSLLSPRQLTVDLEQNAEIHSFSVTGNGKSLHLISSTHSILRLRGDLNIQGMLREEMGSKIQFISSGQQSISAAGAIFSSDIENSGKGHLILLSDLSIVENGKLLLTKGSFSSNGHSIRAEDILPGNKLTSANLSNSIIATRNALSFSGDTRFDITATVFTQEDPVIRGTSTCGAIPFTITTTVTSNYNGQNVSCNGADDATICVNITGGVGPFTISWITGPSTACWSGLGAGNYLVVVLDQGQGNTPCNTNIVVNEPTPLTLFSWTGTNPSCPGVCDGSATPIIIGGTPGYTYNWGTGESTPTANQLCVGLNTLTVTDMNGCSFDTSFFILTPTTLIANINVTDASCFGVCDGVAVSNPAGGNGAPFTFQWSNGSTTATANNLCDGTYTLHLEDANGCPKDTTITVNEPIPITITLTNQVNLVCNNICSGSLTVSAADGVAPYTFQWFDAVSGLPLAFQTSPTASSLCAGQYYVVVTDDNGCQQQSATFTINQPPPITSTSSASPALCFGECTGSLTISASGGTPPFSFQWIDASTATAVGNGTPLNNVCPGTYFAEITDGNGCIINSSPLITVTEPPQLQFNVTPTDAVCHDACDGSAIANGMTGGTGVLTVSWEDNGGNTIQTGNSVSLLCDGNYTAVLTDANGCQEDIPFTINEPAQLTFNISVTEVSCVGTCDGTATISNIAGETGPYSIDWSSSANTALTETGLCSGNYTVSISDVNGCDSVHNFSVTTPPPLTLNEGFTDPTCTGLCDGSADANASGGTPPYSYVWINQSNGNPAGPNQDSITGLCPGNYQVTVTDANGCIGTASVTITNPPGMSASLSTTTSTCGVCDGSADVTITGGTAPFSVSWFDATTGTNTGITGTPAQNLCAGNYFAVVTDINGCSVNSDTVALTDNVIITGNLTSTNPSCFNFCNGSIDLNASGGTPPLSFQWFDQNTGQPIGQSTEDATGLCEGDYYVVITDINNCSSPPLLASVIEPDELIGSITSNDATCEGNCNGTATVTVSGGTPPYSFSWTDLSNGNSLPIPGASSNTLCEGSYSVSVTDANGCIAGPFDFTIDAPPGITATISSTNVSCNGVCDGSATVSVNGGTAPLSVTWSSSANTSTTENNLCTGNYSVSVLDAAGCSFGPINFSINEPTPLTASIADDQLNCNGDCNGSVSVTLNGGTTPYSYQWDANAGNQTTPVASGLCAGSYNVTATDANGCTVGPLTAHITEPVALTLSVNSTDASCSGNCDGSASAIAGGGTAPYSYSWNDPLNQNTSTAINLCGGNFDVLVTDANGCTIGPQTITINQPATLNVSITPTDLSCFGVCTGSAVANVTGGTAPFSFSWNDPASQTTATANGLCADNYSVDVIDANGCTASATTTINEPLELDFTSSSTQSTCNICDGTATVNPIGGVGPYTISWDANTGNQNGSTANSLCAGIYQATVIDANGCNLQTTVAVSDQASEIITLDSTAVSCFGQCDGSVSVSFNCSDPACTIQWNDPSNSTSNIVSNLCAGFYGVTVTNNTGCITAGVIEIPEPDEIDAQANSTDVLCFGNCNGTGIVNPTGGVPPYSIQWDAGAANQTTTIAFNLCTGNYSVTVTDANGCSIVDNVSVSEPPALSATTGFNDPSCNNVCDGTATLFPSGGTIPYSFIWDDPAAQITQQATALCEGQYLGTVIDANGCTFSPAQITLTEPTAITLSVSASSLDCNGDCDGTASATITGGNPPYTIQWDDPLNQTNAIATNLCSGTYSVSITDQNGCTVPSESVTLTNPDALTVSFTFTEPDCNGDCNGSISSVITGGTSPYSLQWNDPALTSTSVVSNLCGGNYELDITDASGCVENFQAVLTEPSNISLGLTATNADCFGNCNGSINSSPTGGTAPYNFNWSNGQTTQNINGLCAGTYQVTLTDANGCTRTGSRVITEPSQLNLSVSSSSTVCGACNGSASASPSGGLPPYSYSWSGGLTTQNINGLCAGIYTVTVTDANGCQESATVAVSNLNAEIVTVTITDPTCFNQCNGSAIANTACNNGPCSFAWFDGTTGNPLGQTTPNANSLCDGDYFVQVTNALGCITIENFTLTEPDELVANPSSTSVSCFGDCNGSTIITPTGGTGAISVQWDANAGNSTATSLTNLCAGTYLVTMTDASGCSDTDTVDITEPLELIVSASSISPQCNGDCNGQGIAIISGGVAPYSISWNDPSTQSTATAVGLCAGNYTVTVTDANGCIENPLVTITDHPVLSATISGIDPVCNNDCNGSATITPSGGVTPYTYQWDDPLLQTNQTANSLCAGNYSVTVTDSAGCAFGPLNVSLTDPTAISINVTSNDITCQGSCTGSISIVASGGDGNFLYSINNGGSFQVSPNFTGLCAGAYTVLVQDGVNCSSVPVNVNINTPTSISATIDEFPADCNVSNGAATVIPSGGVPPYTFQWFDALLNPIGQTTQTAINLPAGNYSVTITDANGCTETINVSVSNVNAPIISANITDVSCFGNCDGFIDVSVASGVAPYSFLWAANGQTTEDLGALCAGGYQLQVTDANGCIRFESFAVNSPAQIQITVTSNDAACGVCDGTASASVSGGTGGFTLDWTTGTTGNSVSNLCAGAYMVQATDNSGCQVTQSFSINNINGPTSETITLNNPSCAGVCDGDISISPIGGTAPYTYFWTHNGSTSNSLNSLCAGTYFLEITDANGCVRMPQVDLTEPAAITDSTVMIPTTCGVCDGSLITFPAGGVAPISIQWSANAGSSTSQAVTNLCAGIYTLILTDANGCRDTSVIPVNVTDSPTPVFSTSDASCENVCDGTASVASIIGGLAPYQVNWTDGNGTPLGTTGTTITGLCAGNYFVQVTDANSCGAFYPFTIDEPMDLQFSLPFTQDPNCFNTCDGIVTAIVIQGTLPYSYQWDDPSSQTTSAATNLCGGTYTVTVTDGNGCSSAQSATITDPPAIVIQLDSTDASCSTVADGAIDATTSGGAGNFTFSWSGPNNFTATTEDISNIFPGWYFLTSTDANGCSHTDSIEVGAVLVVDANAGNDTSLCAGSAGIVLTGAGGVTYQWFDSNGNVISTSDTVTVSPVLGTDFYILEANNNGCVDYDTVNVNVNPLPLANAGPDIDLIINASGSLGGNPTTNPGNSVVWSPGIFLNDSLVNNPTFVSDIPSTYAYVVTVTDPNGCINTDTVIIDVFPDITFPNGFSPNGDGTNDTWIIDLITLFPDAQVEIYNRWGQLLFLSVGYGTPWDGTFNNEPVPVGTYYYVINLNHPLYPDAYTGPLTVLR